MSSVFESARSDIFHDIFAGGGEMGELMRSTDWSKTPLGPVKVWPQSLRTALSICLASRFPMLIWWGPELVKLYNDAYRPLLGTMKHPQALGQRGKECWPEIWDVIGPMLEGVLKEGKATWSDNQLLLLDRSGYIEEAYFTFSYSPIRDETGGIGGVFTAVTETTQQVLGERRLRTLRELAAHSTEAKTAEEACRIAANALTINSEDIPFALLYLLDNDSNQAMLEATTGLQADTPVSPVSVDLQREASDESMIWPLAQVVRSQKPVLLENIQERFGSSSTHLNLDALRSVMILPITRSGQESLYGLLVVGLNPRRTLDDDYRGFFELVAGQIGMNIGHARAYQEEREQVEALEELDRAKTTFFSNVSHEFRTPLTLLLGPIEDVLNNAENNLTAEQREWLKMVQRNALRLLKLVNSLLDFSRIEVGRIQAVYEATDLAFFTEELAKSFREIIQRAGMQFVIDCPPLSEPVYVDREMWEKVVLNLLSNAFKFTFEGQIRIALHQVGDHVELEVQDSGIGIAEEDLPHVFERFHRIRGTRARTFEGSGIGLSLVQELVRLHHGSIRVSSTLGKGSTFIVQLPLGAAHLAAERIGSERTQFSTGIGATAYVEEASRWLALDDPEPTSLETVSNWSDQRLHEAEEIANALILVADDNADMREYLRRLLHEHYSVVLVGDGLSALKVAREQRPDLILSDIMMPGLDGFQLLQTLRSDPQMREIPFILLSARAGEETEVEGLDAGADDYLVKPFSARELLARIRASLSMSRMRLNISRQEQQHAQRLQKLAESSLKITSMQPLEEMLTLVTEQAREIIGANIAIISVTIDQNQEQAVSAFSLADTYAAWRNYQGPLIDQGMQTYLYCMNDSVCLTEDELENHPSWSRFGKRAQGHIPLRGWLAAPLIAQDGRNMGSVHVSDKVKGQFSEEDEAILVQLAQMTSIAVENTRLYQHAQHSIHARDELLSMVSHDLKNPLGAIKGFAQILQRGLMRTPSDDNARLVTGLGRIDAAATRMTALINELLDLAHLQGGQTLEIVRQPVELVALLRRIIGEQQQSSQGHHIRFEANVEELYGNFDTVRIERVIYNLLSNAIKYSPNTEDIILRLTCEEGERGTSAVIAVQDYGIGIPEKDLPHVFEQFRRGENVLGKIKGTGIGLASALHIVELHHGTIAVESKIGQGTTFTVRLPLKEENDTGSR